MNRLEFLHSSQKKILAINGSHRIGNTQFALTKIINQLEKTHSNTHGILINLHEQKINYATWADYGHGYLPQINDDMPLMHSLMQSADVLIFGTPVYFYSVTGRMKTLMDRCNKYHKNEKLKGKLVFTVGVGGSTQPTEMINSLNKFYQTLGVKNIGHQFFRAQHPDDLSKSQEAIVKLELRAKEIASL